MEVWISLIWGVCTFPVQAFSTINLSAGTACAKTAEEDAFFPVSHTKPFSSTVIFLSAKIRIVKGSDCRNKGEGLNSQQLLS